MTHQELERAYQMMAGQVHGLFMFCQTLARLHPDPKTILAHLEMIDQAGVAGLAETRVPEATIEGFEYVTDALRKVLPAAASGG